MKVRLRKAGVGGTIAALLTTGALLLPAAPPAQAQMNKESFCRLLRSSWEYEIEFGDFWLGMRLWEGWMREC
jgi:hypothetical protein